MRRVGAIQRGSGQAFFEHLLVDHGLTRQRPGDVPVLVSSRGILGDRQIVDLQAPASYESRMLTAGLPAFLVGDEGCKRGEPLLAALE